MSTLFKNLASGNSLSEEETYEFIHKVMSGGEEVSDAEIGAFLMGTANRLPTTDELVGGARCLREHMTVVELPSHIRPLVDTCGTGGSGLDTFSTSTAAAFVVAGAGVSVAKHGNRAASSRSGSADVLEALGINLNMQSDLISKCIELVNFGFMFAPAHHAATKRVVLARKALKIRTLFNFLGPLSNPAGADCQVMGVSVKEMINPMAEALMRLGCKRALVVHGSDGLDELTLTGPSYVCELKDGKISNYEFNPENLGLQTVTFDKIAGEVASVNAKRVESILAGEPSAYRDLVSLNAAAAILVSGKSSDLKEGLEMAEQSIDSGKAKNVLEKIIEISKE